MVALCASVLFGSTEDELSLRSVKTSNPEISVSIRGGEIVFEADGKEPVVVRFDDRFTSVPKAVEMFESTIEIESAAILFADGDLISVREDGEIRRLGGGFLEANLEHGPASSVCISGGDACFSSDGELFVFRSKGEKQISSCRITPSTSSVSFSTGGGSTSFSLRFSGCARATVTGIGSFISVNSLTINSSNPTVRVSVGATSSPRAGTLGILGPDGRLAAVIPVEQYPVGTRRGSVSPSRFLAESYASGYRATYITSGGWSSETSPDWISVSGTRNQANSNVGFYLFANPGTRPRFGIVTLRSSSGAISYIHFGQDRR